MMMMLMTMMMIKNAVDRAHPCAKTSQQEHGDLVIRLIIRSRIRNMTQYLLPACLVPEAVA